MSNTNSSIGSQAMNHCNKHHNLKKFDFTWVVRSYDFDDTLYRACKSPLFFPSVDADLQCRIELASSRVAFAAERSIPRPQPPQSHSPVYTPSSPSYAPFEYYAPTSPMYYPSSPPSSRMERCKFVSIFLRLEFDDSYENCDAVLGEVEFSVMKSDEKFDTRKKKFQIRNNGNIQATSYVGFHDYVERTHAVDNCMVEGELTIFCQVFYCMKFDSESCEILDSSLSVDLESLFADRNFSDLTIKVNDKEYYVYKGILAARSPVFKAMFRNDMQENATDVVNISDVGQDVFEEILLYIYCGKVKNLKKLVYELLPLANKYDLKQLMVSCEEILVEQLSKDNAIKILILAHTHHAVWLKTKALEFIKLHARSKDVKGSEIWTVLTSFHPDLMAEMLTVLLDK